MKLDQDLRSELEILESRQLLRVPRSLTGHSRVRVQTDDGRDLLAFCSNDYLGLATHPEVMAAAHRSIQDEGFGSGGPRLVSGQAPGHRQLEKELATFLHLPDTLLFPTGYQTNLGVITALAGPDDLIVSDSANHASIIDGCRLSRASIKIYAHGDVHSAASALATPGPFRRRLLVTESIFSMDGDRAPLAELHAACVPYEAVLIVDEAHALGVIGPGGRGLAAEAGVVPHITVGTLGKAFGAQGGFAAGSETMRSFLINRARQFIYTTAGPACLAAAGAAALLQISSPAGTQQRQHASALARHARLGLRTFGIEVPGQDLILPIVIGEDARALMVSAALLEKGILVPAIRPPTVPRGTSRLRVTISAAHTFEEVDRLVAAIAAALSPHGVGT